MTRKQKDTATKQPKRPNPIPNNKPFVAGDSRINRNGRPKNFDQVRALFQELAAGDVELKDASGKPYKISRATAIGLALSSDKKHMREFLEYAFGKVPQAVDVTSGGEVLTMTIIKASDALKPKEQKEIESPKEDNADGHQ